MSLPSLDLALWRELAMPALLISVVGFVESVSVGQTLAAKRRQRIEPDQELVALGASNLGAAFTGGFPVTGWLLRARSSTSTPGHRPPRPVSSRPWASCWPRCS